MAVLVFSILAVLVAAIAIGAILENALRTDLIQVRAQSDIAFKNAVAATDSLATTQKGMADFMREATAHRESLQAWWASVEERLMPVAGQHDAVVAKVAALKEEQQKLTSLLSDEMTTNAVGVSERMQLAQELGDLKAEVGEWGKAVAHEVKYNVPARQGLQRIARELCEVQAAMRKFREDLKATANIVGETARMIEPQFPAMTTARRRWYEDARRREVDYLASVGERIDSAFNTPEGKRYMEHTIGAASGMELPAGYEGEKLPQLPEGAFMEWVRGHEALRLLAGGEANVGRTAQAALNLGIQVLMTAGEEDARHNQHVETTAEWSQRLAQERGFYKTREPYQVPDAPAPQAGPGAEFESA
jgi:hypothetical protein